MAPIRFLTVQEVLRIHEKQIEGGGRGNDPGVLNMGTVEAMVERAQHGPFWTTKPDLGDRAAFYLRGSAQEHPFVEGNKRTAYEAVDVFLRLNGLKLGISKDDAKEFLLRVAGKDITGKPHQDEPVMVEEMADWIRTNSEKV